VLIYLITKCTGVLLEREIRNWKEVFGFIRNLIKEVIQIVCCILQKPPYLVLRSQTYPFLSSICIFILLLLLICHAKSLNLIFLFFFVSIVQNEIAFLCKQHKNFSTMLHVCFQQSNTKILQDESHYKN
jgi:hypothetical protein